MLRDNLCLVLKVDGRFFVDKKNHQKKEEEEEEEEGRKKTSGNLYFSIDEDSWVSTVVYDWDCVCRPFLV